MWDMGITSDFQQLRTASLAWWSRPPTRVAEPRFDSCFLHGDFSGSSQTTHFKNGTPMATWPGTGCYRVSAGSGWPSVSKLRLGEIRHFGGYPASIRSAPGPTAGVALTFEKLRIANAQHGKNCVSSPAAKATISTDLPKIDKHENTNV